MCSACAVMRPSGSKRAVSSRGERSAHLPGDRADSAVDGLGARFTFGESESAEPLAQVFSGFCVLLGRGINRREGKTPHAALVGTPTAEPIRGLEL